MTADGKEKNQTCESLKLLTLTIINPCCGAFRQISKSPFLRVQQFFLLPLSDKGHKEHLATFIQVGVWTPGRRWSPELCTVSLEG